MGNRSGKKLPRHYYTPEVNIRIVDGVQRKEYDARRDVYSGTAEALESACVLHAAMLPPRISIAWRPLGAKKEDGESWFEVPGYLEVHRQRDETFRAVLTVRREEQAARLARLRKLRQPETVRPMHEPTDVGGRSCLGEVANTALRATWEFAKQEGTRVVAAIPDQVRQYYCIGLTTMKAIVQRDRPWDGCTLNYSTATREQMIAVIGELEELIRTAEVHPLRQPGGGKGHLRLVHSV